MSIPPSNSPDVQTTRESETVEPTNQGSFFASEDWLAMVFGGILLAIGLVSVWYSQPATSVIDEKLAARKEIGNSIKALSKESEDYKAENKKLTDSRKKIEAEIAPTPLKPWIAKPGSWSANPIEAFYNKGQLILPGLIASLIGIGLLISLGLFMVGQSPILFVRAFVAIFLLSTISFLIGGQKVMEHYNLEYALWALVVGLFISNTIGTPEWLRPAMRTELYIKTGLVLLGAEVLFNKLLALGVPGVLVSWTVTPIVLIGTYLFGQHVLRMQSKTLNIVISADMSVCGVSAAIATASACRAKKEELSLAIGLSLGFTVIMMVVMPPLIRIMGLSDVVGGAWIGGTIDSTGAVAAAGEMLGTTAMEVATTIKMIQNILIGVVALGVAIYWSTSVNPNESPSQTKPRIGLSVIWQRFPKFVLGFLAASILFSWMQSTGTLGKLQADATVDGLTKNIRVWLFCIGFVSIGLDSNLREFMKLMSGGKPLVLYVCGQFLNLLLSLAMSWLMFEVIFAETSKRLGQ